MHQHSEFLKRICLGVAGGFLGTLALQSLMAAGKNPNRASKGGKREW